MLYGVMRSHVSNFAARQRPVGTSRRERQPGEGSRFIAFDDQPDEAAITDRSYDAPDEILLNEELRDRIRELVADDDVLERMVEILFDDPTCSAADLADQLETTIPEIYNARKRLRRRLKTLRP
jgi:DNA-directed RNA polymerase specialized sigma24 family protein